MPRKKKRRRGETVLCINPHTLEVTEELHYECQKCRRVLPKTRFYRAVREKRTSMCKSCYDRYWMTRHDRKTEKDHIAMAVFRANRRSRVRCSVGPPITNEEAHSLWVACEGKCANCRAKLTWKFHPRKSQNSDLAVLDRVETGANKSYHDNARWCCTTCNEEKGGWDLCAQLKQEIRDLRRRLKRKRASPSIMYRDILMQ